MSMCVWLRCPPLQLLRNVLRHSSTSRRTLRVLYNIYRKEGNVLFNDALKTFDLRLYGVGHMVKDHSDSERENPLPPHGLLFPISSKGSFICTIPQTTYHSLVYTSRGALALQEGRNLFYLTTHSKHFIYGYMASDIWLRTILIVREETHCCHMGYSFQ